MTSKNEIQVLQPRSYQLELLEYVMQRNAIIFLPTGSGKTFVALLALKRFSHEMERPISQGGKRGLFMCNTVELARQQALQLKKSINLNVGLYVGERGVDDWSRKTWEEEIESNQVMVGTAQIFVDIINQNYIKVTDLSIVVLDECHHATGGHPMHQFLSKLQKSPDQTRLPRVIGLTGVLIKGNKLTNVEKDLRALEATFRGNIITVSNMEQYHNVMIYSTKPKEDVVTYCEGSVQFDLENVIIKMIDDACTIVDTWSLGNIPIRLSKGLCAIREPNKKNFIKNLLKDFLYQMKDFGIYAASIAIMSVIIELEIKKRQAETIALRNLYRSVITYCERIRHLLVKKLQDMVDEIDGNIDTADVILNFSSPKMRSLLMYCMTNFERMEPKDICCLVFVDRRYTAKCVYYVIQKFVDSTPSLAKVLRPAFMVGRNTISPGIQNILDRKWNKDAIDRFRDKECNLIVCSSVLEEGIDVQACNYVIALDPLKTFNSYIQTKGRARKTGSTYAIFTSKQDMHKVVSQIREYQAIHEIIKNFLIGRTIDQDDPKEEEVAEQFVYPIKPFVIKSGACLSAESALQTLSRYCQQLPSDVFGSCTPWWSKEKVRGKVVVTLKLPLQSTVKDTVASDPMETIKLAKMSAAFKTCVKLYENGELNDQLLPITKRECVAKVTNIFFKHWEKYADDNTKTAGSKQNRRSYERLCPAELYQAMPIVGKPCYAYEIVIKPEFELDNSNAHLIDLMKSSSNYAILLSKRLPPLAEMPLFMTQGKIAVKIASSPKQCVIESEQQLEQLRIYHTMLFRDLLQCWKENKFFVIDRRNEQNSFLLTPLKNGTIDWHLVSNFQRLSPIRKYSAAERQKKQYKPEDYIGKIVNTWYSLNETERYVVTKVLTDNNPGSHFPSGNFDSYADFVEQKYGQEVINMQQFLIEVKCLTSRRNFFVNAKNKMSKNMANRKEATIVLIPEMCHNFMYPGDMWLKALFLPSILHRLNFMLHAENLRTRINDFLGVKTTVIGYQPKPLIIDSSLKRVVDADGNVIDEAEEPQKLLPALPSVQKRNDYFQVHTLSHETNWKDYMEPNQNVQTNVNALFPVEIDYYYKFISGLAVDLEALVLENAEEYTNSQLTMPKPKKVLNSTPATDLGEVFGIADVPLDDRRRIQILERSFAASTVVSSAEQSEFLAALTTAGANDVFDMERFEVLGDSFLKLSMSLYLMHKFPKWHEGYLTEVKSKLVSNRNLLYCMRESDLPQRICATAFKPNSEWLPPLVSVPSNVLELLKQKPPTIAHIAPADLYSLELGDEEVLAGICSREKLTSFINSCSQHQTVADLMTFESDVLTFIYKQSISDKVVADALESILGVCVQNYGIQQSFRMLQFFGLCKDINGKSLADLFDLNLGSPLLRTNITMREVDGFLINYQQLELNLGYHFKDRAYLLQALTHPSYPTNRLTGCYQELEFIGDAILDFLVSCYIFERCETKNPGELTDLRSALVNNITLGCVCVRHRFHLFLLSENAVLAESIKNFAEFQKTQNYCVTDQVRILMEENDCKPDSLNLAVNIDVPKTLGDVVEALIAAVYLDCRDLMTTWNVIYKLLQQEINQFMCNVPIDPVRQLYECKGADPKFTDPIVDTEVVMVKCWFTCLNERREVNGFGPNKTNAKKSAAKHALQILSRN